MKKYLAVALMLSVSGVAMADYASDVMATNPVAYFRLNEDPAALNDVAANEVAAGVDAYWGYLGGDESTLPISGQTEVQTTFPGVGTANTAPLFIGQQDDGLGLEYDDMIDLNYNYDYDECSVSFFVQINDDDWGNEERIYTTGTAANNEFKVLYRNHGLEVSLDSTATNSRRTLTWWPSHNTVFHVVAVRNGDAGGTQQIYINAADEMLTDVGVDSNWTTEPNALFGARHAHIREGWGGYEGILDELVIWDRALTSIEVNTLYESALTPDEPTDIDGDLDGDGFVGGLDLNIVLSAWGDTVTRGSWIEGDPSGDAFVGGEDLNFVLTNWGDGEMPTGPVPEPATMSLLAVGAASVLLRRKR